MNSSLYRNFLRLLERWPLDPTKKGRDLGEYIRSGIAVAFRGGSDEPRDLAKCEEIYSRLSNIANNKYKVEFPPTSNTSTALGLSQEECREAVSNEFLQVLEEEDAPLREKVSKLFKK